MNRWNYYTAKTAQMRSAMTTARHVLEETLPTVSRKETEVRVMFPHLVTLQGEGLYRELDRVLESKLRGIEKDLNILRELYDELDEYLVLDAQEHHEAMEPYGEEQSLYEAELLNTLDTLERAITQINAYRANFPRFIPEKEGVS